jgi:hypothetical protein
VHPGLPDRCEERLDSRRLGCHTGLLPYWSDHWASLA